MKKLYTLILLAMVATTLQATVKPRYRGAQATAVQMNETEVVGEMRGQGPRRVGVHSDAPLASVGSPRVPVILVQFPDLKFTSGLPDGAQCETQEDIEAVAAYFDLFCNGLRDDTGYYTGAGSLGAIREYFRDQSAGQFTPDFHVIGPVTLDNGYAYYGKNGSSKDTNINSFFKDGIKKAQELVNEWNMFDNDGNGTVDMAFFVFAGEGENAYNISTRPEAADYIWPKEMASGGTIDGVEYGCYACCNETYKGNPDGIGVFVHELSHALGLPDLYDYNYVAFGMDYWDIMDSGCYCNDGKVPCGYSAYEKDFMGWQSLNALDTDTPEHLVLEPLHAGGQAYKMVNPGNANEYYILENRQTGLWDSFIGKGTEKTKMHGMLITHIDYLELSWRNNRLNSSRDRQRCSVVPADGEIYSYMNVENLDEYNSFYLSAIADLFPGSQMVTEWEGTQDVTMPYKNSAGTLLTQSLPISYSGSPINQPLRNIVEREDGVIELDYCPDGKLPTDISAALLTERRDATVYTLSGVAIGKVRMQGQHPTLDGLPAGIYIVDKRKYTVK